MANLIILAVHLPRITGTLLGGFVLLSDNEDRCEVAFRGDWSEMVAEDDAEVLDGMEETLQEMLKESSAVSIVGFLEERFSNVIRCSERFTISSEQSLSNHAQLLRRALLSAPNPDSNTSKQIWH